VAHFAKRKRTRSNGFLDFFGTFLEHFGVTFKGFSLCMLLEDVFRENDFVLRFNGRISLMKS